MYDSNGLASLPDNLVLVQIARDWAERKNAPPRPHRAGMADGSSDAHRPIPATTQTAHMEENIGTANLTSTEAELAELDTAVRARSECSCRMMLE